MLKEQVSLEAMAILAETAKGKGKRVLNRFSSVKVRLVGSKQVFTSQFWPYSIQSLS